jgi:hypothetical protein
MGRVEPVFGVVGDDAARLLAAVLQGMQAEGYKVCRVADAQNAKNATFFAQFIIIKRVRGGQRFGHEGCSESGRPELPPS